MDIIKAAPHIPFYRKYWLFIAGAIVLVGAFALFSKYRGVSFIVFRDQIVTATVEQGELVVSISAYGQLEPRGVYRVDAESEGMVESIAVNPGDSVHAGQPLLQLINPQLVRHLRDMELDLEAREAELEASLIEQDSHLLALATDIVNAELDYQLASKDLEAKQKLLSGGMQIISSMELERAVVMAEQYRQRWQVLQDQYSKLEESNAARSRVEQVRMKQLENAVADVREQVANLKVRASIAGTVQELGFELGQRVLPGQLITRIANTDQLIASVRVPELQVNDIKVGMPATIDTRVSIINGRVLRIDPVVTSGTVRIELTLLDTLPEEVRPELNIEASIEVARVADTMYVRRPVSSREFESAEIFRLEENGDFATRVPVGYGYLSSRFAEIAEGLAPGDQVIVSDSRELMEHQRIFLK